MSYFNISKNLNFQKQNFTFFQAGSSCTNPKVTATSYTASDAQVLTHVPFITEFGLACSNGASGVNLYANVDGSLLPVVKSADGKKYQVSWTKDLKEAKPGDYEVRARLLYRNLPPYVLRELQLDDVVDRLQIFEIDAAELAL